MAGRCFSWLLGGMGKECAGMRGIQYRTEGAHVVIQRNSRRLAYYYSFYCNSYCHTYMYINCFYTTINQIEYTQYHVIIIVFVLSLQLHLLSNVSVY